MPFSIEDIRLTGCLFGVPDKRDFHMAFGNRRIPDTVDLRPYCTPVENQGRIGSCAANAAVGALEYYYKRRDGHAPDLSRMFVYYNTRRMTGHIHADTGARINEVMASILAFGVCQEAVWPYDPVLFAREPGRAAYEDATKHEAMQYARVGSGLGPIYALADGHPVVFGTLLPMRCYREAASTGVIPELSEAERLDAILQSGGHAMLIVGYDRRERMYIVRNSWGEQWGDRGYCKFPFDVMDAFSPPEAFWILADLERSQNLSLVRPGRDTSGGRLPEMKLGGMAATAAKMREELRAGLEAEIGASSRKIDKLVSRRGEPDTKEEEVFKSGCTYCWGRGICWFCRGNGVGCTRCGGTGTCWICRGKSQDPRYRRSSSGTGSESPRRSNTMKLEACAACGGVGVCPRCGGRKEGCSHCRGTALCAECGGLGMLG